MLWKLADNVKYEEDCEVRRAARGAGGQRGGGGRGSPEPPGRCAPPARLQPRFLHSPSLCFAFLCFAYFFKPFFPSNPGEKGKNPGIPSREEGACPSPHAHCRACRRRAAPRGASRKSKSWASGEPPGRSGGARVKGGSPSRRGEPRLNRGVPSGQQGQVGAEAGLQPSRAALPTFLSAVGAAPVGFALGFWALTRPCPPALGSGRRAVGPASRPAGTPFASHHPAVVFYRPEAAGPQDRVRVDV